MTYQAWSNQYRCEWRQLSVFLICRYYLQKEGNLEGLQTYLSMTTAGVWEAMVERGLRSTVPALWRCYAAASKKASFGFNARAVSCGCRAARLGMIVQHRWHPSRAITRRGVVKRARDVPCVRELGKKVSRQTRWLGRKHQGASLCRRLILLQSLIWGGRKFQ
jgi:hypothetical protein